MQVIPTQGEAAHAPSAPTHRGKVAQPHANPFTGSSTQQHEIGTRRSQKAGKARHTPTPKQKPMASACRRMPQPPLWGLARSAADTSLRSRGWPWQQAMQQGATGAYCKCNALCSAAKCTALQMHTRHARRKQRQCATRPQPPTTPLHRRSQSVMGHVCAPTGAPSASPAGKRTPPPPPAHAMDGRRIGCTTPSASHHTAVTRPVSRHAHAWVHAPAIPARLPTYQVVICIRYLDFA